MVFVDPVLQHRGENNNPPPSPTGCAPHDAVVSMLHHLESTYRWETEWDDRHEDTYWDGEMTSYRRIVLPEVQPQLLPPSHQQGDAKEESSSSTDNNTATSNITIISFIFVEDQMHSYCFITSNKSTSSCTVTMKEKYDKIMAALEDGKDLLLAAAAADEEEEE